MEPLDPLIRQRANTVFWSSFCTVVIGPTALAVIPAIGKTNKLESVIVLAFGAVASLVLPAGMIAAILSRPIRVHGARGPLIALLLMVAALTCGVGAGVWWAARPAGEIGWPLTGALWRQFGWASLILLPVLLLTLFIDVAIQIAFAVAQALAPALVPTFGMLAGALAAWMLVAMVLKVQARLQR